MLQALDRNTPSFMKLAAAAFKSRRPNKAGEPCKPAKLEQGNLTGKHAIVKGIAAKLLTPEIFQFKEFTKLIDDMVAEGAVQRSTDSEVAGFVRKVKDKPSSDAAPKTKKKTSRPQADTDEKN